MRIAYITAELAPYAQVGGLGDVARWLPAALADAGEDVRIFVPHYDTFDVDPSEVQDLGITVDLGPLGVVAVSRLGAAVPIYLLGSDRWFHRGAVYDGAGDDHLRFAALTAGALNAADEMGWIPDVIHANDWHAGLAARYRDLLGGEWTETPIVFTIHNLAHQGGFPATDLPRMGLAEGSERTVNPMQEGITGATMVTTVSPTFAREIIAPGGGFGLEQELRDCEDRLVGILNGVGDEWDPATDRWIPHRYRDPSGKAPNRDALRTRLGLRDAAAPILGVVSRLDRQKGFGLLRSTIPPLLEQQQIQLAVLGRGDPELESMFAGISSSFPEDAAFESAFDRGLGHLIEAGSDIFLMPSRFEPSGLNQMYSMKYGTVPVVRRVGGLADTVEEWNGTTGTGFVFEAFEEDAFVGALDRALTVFRDRDQWTALQRNGMERDFTWNRAAEEYRSVYRRALGG